MPSLIEWWNKNPHLHNQSGAEIAKKFLHARRESASQANAAFLEQEKLEDQIRQLKKQNRSLKQKLDDD